MRRKATTDMSQREGAPVLVLGSSSPRRKELLTLVGLSYEVVKPETNEVPHPGEAPNDYAWRNALEKAEWVAQSLRSRASLNFGAIVISADTIVVLNGDILEKPKNAAHARKMLQRLSGKSHTVISGVSLKSLKTPAESSRSFTVSTEVEIKTLTSGEIDAYVRTGEPLDKAGGYAAQGIGSYMVKRIIGSYANVVGLPIAEVVESLDRDFGYPLWQ